VRRGELPELAETAPVAPPLARFGKSGRSACKQTISLTRKEVAKVHAYILRRRISLAQDLLPKQPALSIDEISAKTGFSSSTHLATVFNRQVGCSPSAFRRLRSH
jgi:AraC-like DNA-binding protein